MRRASKAFLRALHKIRAPNPFEDAARGRDPILPQPSQEVTRKTEDVATESGITTDRRARADRGEGDGMETPPLNSKRGRGRPLITDERPWQLAGVSRRTWYRRGGKTT